MKIDILNRRIRFDFSVSKTVDASGIDSNIDTENVQHILLWDFDDASYSQIVEGLRSIQTRCKLPTIHIIESSPKHFHAYCFTVVDKSTAMYIISSTPCIDYTFFKLGVVRGYWTLRITPKKRNHLFHHVADLVSTKVAEDTSLSLLLEIVKYKTGV
jgi:hypothetical protein